MNPKWVVFLLNLDGGNTLTCYVDFFILCYRQNSVIVNILDIY